MDITFNVFDVLRIAEEVQHKAAGFYLAAARQFSDSRRCGICYDLAFWRVRHEQAWGRLRRDLYERMGQQGRFSADADLVSDLGLPVGLAWFGSGWEVCSGFFAHLTVQQILRDARRRSNEITVFYRGLRYLAYDAESRSMIDNVIAEEQRHVAVLSRLVNRIQPLNSTPRYARSLCAAV